jgi:hypothetical protein
MRYVHCIVVGFFLVFCGCKASMSTTGTTKVESKDTTVYNKVYAMEFLSYIDKKDVNTFLKDVGIDYVKYTFGTVRNSYLRFVYFVYSEDLWVEVQVNEFVFLESYSKEHKWNIEDFKKEKISAIRLIYKGNCVKCLGDKY